MDKALFCPFQIILYQIAAVEERKAWLAVARPESKVSILGARCSQFLLRLRCYEDKASSQGTIA